MYCKIISWNKFNHRLYAEASKPW